MDALNYLRKEIKSYFPESSELMLSSYFANHPRFNFYFKIIENERYLLYLNWDGDDLRYTLKCLEFNDWETLKGLIDFYPSAGSKAFNIGKPRTVISFLYREEGRLAALEYKGAINHQTDSPEISGNQLLRGIDPFPR
ncbi:hypothetical protein [Dyadobacter arcticus]|uniref:Uncharacterized protein n=1 Tax=Dyadobacter arcticus TaxID=1078754 RepID=A0ABX0UPB3_9BACT|nr:hypothetical protein [Dyadobacter arcticus]NIJ54787.1 hypothetical protein [Dyadobacter arcticus]